MKFFVFKPKRRKNGKLLVGRLYRGRYRLEEDSESMEVPLKVTDKQVALSKMERLVREAQDKRYRITPPGPAHGAHESLLVDRSGIDNS